MKKCVILLIILLSQAFAFSGELKFDRVWSFTGTFNVKVEQISDYAWTRFDSGPDPIHSNGPVVLYSGTFYSNSTNVVQKAFQAPDSQDNGEVIPYGLYRITISTNPASSQTWVFTLDLRDENWCGPPYRHPDTYFKIEHNRLFARMQNIGGGVTDLTINNGGSYTIWDLWDVDSIDQTHLVPPLNVNINGISSYSSKYQGHWTADVTGGSGNFEYEWRESFDSANGPWSSVKSTLSYWIKQLWSGNYYLQLKVTDTQTNNIEYKTHTVHYTGDPLNKIVNDDQKTDIRTNTFELKQNYPNPFNPTTNISYSIQQDNHVNIEVYNSVGEKVQTLVNKTQSAGTYMISFDGKDLPSGLYIYRIKSGKFVATKKMILMK